MTPALDFMVNFDFRLVHDFCSHVVFHLFGVWVNLRKSKWLQSIYKYVGGGDILSQFYWFCMEKQMQILMWKLCNIINANDVCPRMQIFTAWRICYYYTDVMKYDILSI